MRIAIAALGPDPDSKTSPSLGRARYFILADPAAKDFRAVANPYAGEKTDIGVRAAGLLVELGVDAVLAGNCGPRTALVLREAGVHVGIAYKGTAREVLEQYLRD
ncbi:MAG: NifB/NifX family molybdenum-iron cluster-binding protein [Desulfovibrionaceae bacterium]|nr:NifB/NifX family molybdenum-iron cluster-binding protein [Desulfovibrionaceae bacterium]